MMIGAALAALLSAQGLAADGPKKSAPCRETVHFRCRLPAGWTQSRSPRLERAEKVYGLEASGPEKASGTTARMTVDYFAADNAVHKDMAAYIAAQTRENQAFRMPGEKYGPVSDIQVGGHRGRVFERETFFFWPPDHPKAAKIPQRERFVVLPARQGFFALSYRAPASLYDKGLPAFEQVLSSFAPLH